MGRYQRQTCLALGIPSTSQKQLHSLEYMVTQNKTGTHDNWSIQKSTVAGLKLQTTIEKDCGS